MRLNSLNFKIINKFAAIIAHGKIPVQTTANK